MEEFETDNSEEEELENKVDWEHSTVDPGTQTIYYRCGECDRELIASPRFTTRVLPSLFCDCDEVGYPFSPYKVKFVDGEVVERDE